MILQKQNNLLMSAKVIAHQSALCHLLARVLASLLLVL